MFIKKIFYGKNYVYLYQQDLLLDLLMQRGVLENKMFYKDKITPQGFNQVMEQLEYDGFIKTNHRYTEITLKGSMKIKAGGLLRDSFKKRLSVFGVFVGIVASIIAIISFFLYLF